MALCTEAVNSVSLLSLIASICVLSVLSLSEVEVIFSSTAPNSVLILLDNLLKVKFSVDNFNSLITSRTLSALAIASPSKISPTFPFSKFLISVSNNLISSLYFFICSVSAEEKAISFTPKLVNLSPAYSNILINCSYYCKK